MYAPATITFRWLDGVTITMLDLWSKGHEFDSRSGCYQVVTTWMCDCLRTGKPSWYMTNHQNQFSLSSLRGRQAEYCLSEGGRVHLCMQVTRCDPIWQMTLRSTVMGYHYKLQTTFRRLTFTLTIALCLISLLLLQVNTLIKTKRKFELWISILSLNANQF